MYNITFFHVIQSKFTINIPFIKIQCQVKILNLELLKIVYLTDFDLLVTVKPFSIHPLLHDLSL